ncbi:MFS transporter, SP family, sugar:H+ symporter, partial [Tremellales sp. Uapishka_1]
MPQYQKNFGTCDAAGTCTISTTRESAITGLLSVGAVIGAVGSGYVSDRIGLRMTCIVFIAVYMAGAAIETSAFTQYAQICVARLLTGLGIGVTSGLVPVFQAEVSPAKFRGLVTGSFQLCVTLGIFGVSVCNYGMAYKPGNVSWRLTTGLQMLWAALLLVGFVLCPESPRFYAKQGKWEECRKALANMRGLAIDDPELDVEMDEVAHHAEEDKLKGDVSYKEIFSTKDRILWRVMIGVCVQIGQQITGINFFFSYGVQFAQAAGLDDSYVFQIILATVNLAMSFPGIYFVDRFGRRPVLLIGTITMFSSQLIVGAVSLTHSGPAAGDALIAFTCVFIAAFASSFGPVAWVVCGETFPIRLSSICVTLGTGANWLFNLIIAFAAPQIQAKIGTSITFVWAGCLLLSFIFVFMCVPETKGMSIEEIDAMYISKTPAWRSGRFKQSQEKAQLKSHEKHLSKSVHAEDQSRAPSERNSISMEPL